MSKVFVGKIPERTSESSLRRLFEEHGDVRSIEMKGTFAFVIFETENQAQNAIEKLNGAELDGANIVVETIRQNNPNKDNHGKLIRRLDLRILIKGLARGTNWTDLKDWARSAGEVTYTNVFEKDGQTLGVVEYKTQDFMDKALRTLEDLPIKGQNVRVEKDDPNAEHHNIPPNRGPFRGGPGGGRGGNDRGFDRRRDAPRDRSRDRERDRSRDRPRYDAPRYDRDDYDRRPYNNDYRPRSPPRSNPPPQAAPSYRDRSHSRDRSRSRERSRYWDGHDNRGPPNDYRRDYDNNGGRQWQGNGGGYDDRRGPSPDRRPPTRGYYDDNNRYDRR